MDKHCISGMPTHFSVTIETDVGPIVLNRDGSVEYPDDLPAAAKAFWNAVREVFPYMEWGEK